MLFVIYKARVCSALCGGRVCCTMRLVCVLLYEGSVCAALRGQCVCCPMRTVCVLPYENSVCAALRGECVWGDLGIVGGYRGGWCECSHNTVVDVQSDRTSECVFRRVPCWSINIDPLQA